MLEGHIAGMGASEVGGAWEWYGRSLWRGETYMSVCAWRGKGDAGVNALKLLVANSPTMRICGNR